MRDRFIRGDGAPVGQIAMPGVAVYFLVIAHSPDQIAAGHESDRQGYGSDYRQ
jgi:hypothetical protein